MTNDLNSILQNLKQYPFPVEIEGDCTITNYKKADMRNVNPFTIKQKDGQISVNGMARQNYKDIESTFNVFTKIASMDGNAQNLTAEDLQIARKDFGSNKSVWENLGVSSFRYDPKEDVANVTINGQTLRIDFDKTSSNKPSLEVKKPENTQQKQQTPQTEKSAVVEQTEQKSEAKTVQKAAETKKDDSVKKTDSVKKADSAKKTVKTKTTASAGAAKPNKYAGMKKEWIPYIQKTAKKYGYSEELIISKIMYEGFTPVAKFKNEGGKNGLVEVGFGHTTNANHNNKFKAGYKISLNEAFDWLGQDIKDKEAKIEEFGEYYNYKNIPAPLKEMMIDVAFNRGEKRLDPGSRAFDDNYKFVRANIKEGYWGSAAVRLRQEEFSAKIKRQGKEPGLRKRNVLRFLKLMDYLSPDKVIRAMDLFNREYYYTKTINMLKQTEADSLKQQWNKIYYEAKAKCAKQQA